MHHLQCLSTTLKHLEVVGLALYYHGTVIPLEFSHNPGRTIRTQKVTFRVPHERRGTWQNVSMLRPGSENALFVFTFEPYVNNCFGSLHLIKNQWHDHDSQLNYHRSFLPDGLVLMQRLESRTANCKAPPYSTQQSHYGDFVSCPVLIQMSKSIFGVISKPVTTLMICL